MNEKLLKKHRHTNWKKRISTCCWGWLCKLSEVERWRSSEGFPPELPAFPERSRNHRSHKIHSLCLGKILNFSRRSQGVLLSCPCASSLSLIMIGVSYNFWFSSVFHWAHSYNRRLMNILFFTNFKHYIKHKKIGRLINEEITLAARSHKQMGLLRGPASGG